MKKIYFEVSAINRVIDQGETTLSALLKSLQEHGQEAVVGFHVVYELARTFLDPEGVARGKRLFQWLFELGPSFSPEPNNLLRQEIDKLRYGSAVLPVLHPLDGVSARLEVSRLASGNSEEARSFIASREKAIRIDHPQLGKGFIRNIEEFRRKNPGKLKGIRSFGDVLGYFDPQLHKTVRQVLGFEGIRITPGESKELKERLNEFPALRSTVYANIYLNFVCITKRVLPSLDKLDDHRHVIEASYCDAIVIEDQQFRRNANLINPDLKVISLADLLRNLQH